MAVSVKSTASAASFLETAGQWFYRNFSMAAPFFGGRAEHPSCQEMPWGRSEMKKQLTCQSLMRYEAPKPPVLEGRLDVSGGDARALRAINLKIQDGIGSQPQKRRFPGRD